METENQIRIKLAEEITLHYARKSSVGAVLLTGSVAQSRAGPRSDVDMIVYHNEPIDNKAFQAMKQAAKNSGGGFYRGNRHKGFSLYHRVRGIRCDIGHAYVERTADMINRFTDNPTAYDGREHVIFSGIMDGVPMHGRALLEQWKTKLGSFPDPLQARMLEKFLDFDPLLARPGNRGSRLWERSLGRLGRRYTYYDRFLRSQGNLLGTLCALNRRYHPGKVGHIEWYFSRMEIAPTNLVERLKLITDAELDKGAVYFSRLIADLLDLVDRHTPGMETAAIRARF